MSKKSTKSELVKQTEVQLTEAQQEEREQLTNVIADIVSDYIIENILKIKHHE